MLRLASTDKLQAVLAGAVSTTQPQAIVCYSDKSTSGYAGGKQLTALNSTTDVDILTAPAASTVRDIDYISIYNRDTASATVTVKYDVSSTDSIIIVVILATLETLQYVHGSGWAVLTSSGSVKTTYGGVVAAANGGTGFGSYTVGDVLYADTTTSLARLNDIATGNALISGGVGTAPSWGKIALATHVSGTLPVANGGTGVTSSTGSGSVALSATPTFTGTVNCDALTPTGLVDISGASAGQIKFPATQNASANANTLDDYEEGTFTPTIISSGGGSPTYSQQVGTYTKIGQLVTFEFRVLITATGTLAAGNVTWGGLPFTSNATSNNFRSVACWISSVAAGVNSVQGFLLASATEVVMHSFAAGTNTQLTVANLTANTNCVIGGSYRI